MYHFRSFVIKVGSQDVQFNFDSMLNHLESAYFIDLREQLTTRYSPWTNNNAVSVHRHLNIFLTIMWLMLQGISAQRCTPLWMELLRINESLISYRLEPWKATIKPPWTRMEEIVTGRKQLNLTSNQSPCERKRSPPFVGTLANATL
jgi:hypothetical protein